MLKEQVLKELRKIDEQIKKINEMYLSKLYKRKEELQMLCPHDDNIEIVHGDTDYLECKDCGKFYY